MAAEPSSLDALETGRDPAAGDSVSIMARNIEVLRRERVEAHQNARPIDRAAIRIARFAGSISFIALHLAVLTGWIVVNAGWISAIRPFDPTFVTLATGASVEAIFLSVTILMSQTSAAANAERRSELDLQISLLAEHEITRLLGLTLAIARHLGIDEAHDPDTTQLAAHVTPEDVLQEISRAAQGSSTSRNAG